MPIRPAVKDIEFANRGGISLHLDIHYPPAGDGPFPVVLGIPGGGWRVASRQHVPLALAEHGFALACIEYRISQDAVAPANIQDCKAALRWLQANAAQLDLDSRRIGVYGASAGGHLAALLGLSAGAEALEDDEAAPPVARDAIKAVCAVCGPSDLTRIGIPEVRERFPLLYEVTEAYLGGSVTERTALARLVSPLTYVTVDAPPMLLIHGSADDVVPLEESLVLYDALQKAGAPVQLKIIEGGGHGWFVEETTDEVGAFFKTALRA